MKLLPGGYTLQGAHELHSIIEPLLDQFSDVLEDEIKKKKLRRATVRLLIYRSITIVITSENICIASERNQGMGVLNIINYPQKSYTINELYNSLIWDLGLLDPTLVFLPKSLLQKSKTENQKSLQAIAEAYITSEVNRILKMSSLVQINPIFGPASYSIDNRLVFVIMPFTEDLSLIYNSLIKPCIENSGFNLVCRRGDDYQTNKAIMQDIWKAICEARIIIADMTSLNPNVMYELGIAHTLGKETILINQKGVDIKFPFDLTHIRRIEYSNDVVGAKKLESSLLATIDHIISGKN